MIRPVIAPFETRRGKKDNAASFECTMSEAMLFDGCGAHITLGYLPSEFSHVFRQVFDAAVAMLPEGSHFVSGARVNYQVLPTKSIKKANSYMIDLGDEFNSLDKSFLHWVGEISRPTILWSSLTRSGKSLLKGSE